jgi:hypothetical protein
VKPETAKGQRRSIPRRKRKTSRSAPSGDVRPASQHDADFDPVEFAEFLEADDGPLPIDPAFKEALRERLWEMVRGGPAPGSRGRNAPRRSS